MKKIGLLGLAICLSILSPSCNSGDEPEKTDAAGKLVLNFEHFIDGVQAEYDNMKYTNAAGNQYEVTEIQWFISDITLIKSDGSSVILGDDKFAHYIDSNIPETSSWVVPDAILVDNYSKIKMTFGIKGEKNIPFMFSDPPESDMIWPTNLGGDNGGYHYMKLNGFWQNADGLREPFNFHLGVGQDRDNSGNITGFVQNWFEVELPTSSFSIAADETKNISIRMNVEKWWESPNIYNHDEVGSRIMQNQAAMRMGIENGQNVFSIGSIESEIAE